MFTKSRRMSSTEIGASVSSMFWGVSRVEEVVDYSLLCEEAVSVIGEASVSWLKFLLVRACLSFPSITPATVQPRIGSRSVLELQCCSF